MRFYIILICTMLLFGCSDLESNTKNNLLGVWGSSDDGGKSFWGFDEYLPDGTLVAWGEVPGSSITFNLEADYEIKKEKDLMVCVTVKNTSHMEVIPVGESWCVEIIEIKMNTFTYRDRYNEIVTLFRQ